MSEKKSNVDSRKPLNVAIAQYEHVVNDVKNAMSAAAPLGFWEPDTVSDQSFPCSDGSPSRGSTTTIFHARGEDASGVGFWDRTWLAAKTSAAENGFQQSAVVVDRVGEHSIVLSGPEDAKMWITSIPDGAESPFTRTTIFVQSGCHPNVDSRQTPDPNIGEQKSS